MENNKFYQLFEFANEDCTDEEADLSTPVQVAFIDWVDLQQKSCIADLIKAKTLVSTKYPINVDVVCKERFSKQTKQIEWKVCVGKILGQSNDWVEIKEMMKTYLSKGVIRVEKGDRKKIAKLNDGESSAKPVGGKGKTSVRSTKKNAAALKRQASDCLEVITGVHEELATRLHGSTQIFFQHANGPTADKSGAVPVPPSTSGEAKRLKKYEDEVFKASNDFIETDTDEEDSKALTKGELSSKVAMLQMENRDLRRRCRTVEMASNFLEDAKGAMKEIKTMLPYLEDAKAVMKEWSAMRREMLQMKEVFSQTLDQAARTKENESSDSNNDLVSAQGSNSINNCDASSDETTATTLTEQPIPDFSRAPSPTLSSTSTLPAHSLPTVSSTLNATLSTAFLKDHLTSPVTNITPTPATPSGSGLKSTPKALLKSAARSSLPMSKKLGKNDVRPQPVFDSQKLEPFGSVTVTGLQLSKCKHSGKISRLAADLCALVYTEEEMSLSTLTGEAPNAYKAYFQKRRLDDVRLQAIIDYVFRVVINENITKEEVTGEVKKAIQQKLNNFSKSPAGKLILEQHGQHVSKPETSSETINSTEQ